LDEATSRYRLKDGRISAVQCKKWLEFENGQGQTEVGCMVVSSLIWEFVKRYNSEKQKHFLHFSLTIDFMYTVTLSVNALILILKTFSKKYK
jgi:hypothetical protein